jgi:shikimate kinase
MNKVLIIFIRGIPGCGKTTLAKMLVDKRSFIVDPDNISSNHLLKYKSLLKDVRVKYLKYRINLKKVINGVRKYDKIFWVQPWRKQSGIVTTIENIKLLTKHSDVKILFILIEISTSTEVAWKRTSYNKRRFLYRTKKNFNEYCSKYLHSKLLIRTLRLNGESTLEELVVKSKKFIHNNKLKLDKI